MSDVMIEPTRGRIVLYHPSKEKQHLGDTLAAVICHVWPASENSFVNLSVFKANGDVIPATSVRLIQPGQVNPVPDDHWCEWMPYQQGQAAKTETVVADYKALSDEILELTLKVEEVSKKADPVEEMRSMKDALEELLNSAISRISAIEKQLN